MTEKCKVSELLPNPYNRELNRRKIDHIKDEIKRTGEIRPLVYSEVDNDGKSAKMITDGHHRFVALKELGHTEVPVVLSDERGLDTKAPKADVEKYITSSNGKWTVHAESGKHMGTYGSRAGAVHRLQQIEYFKHKKMASVDVKVAAQDMAKSWFFDAERHAEAARRNGADKTELHHGLKTALKVAALATVAAGGIIALRHPVVREAIETQTKRFLNLLPKAKTTIEEIAMPHGAQALPKGFKASSMYVDEFKNLPYQKFEKNRVFKYENMSPDEYLNRAAKGFNMSKEALLASRTNKYSTPLVNKYTKMFKQGSKAEALALDYTNGFSQEGIHRAMAAKKVGLAEVPVVLAQPASYSYQEKFHYLKGNKGITGDYVASEYAKDHGLHPEFGHPIETATLHLKVHPNKEVLIYKNPGHKEINDLVREHNEKYPKALSGEPKIRATQDAAGNRYAWMSGNAVHSEVEPALESLTGVKHSQNAHLLTTPAKVATKEVSTGISAVEEAPLATAAGRKELAEEATHQFGDVKDFDWEANKKILWNPVFRDSGLSHDVLKDVVTHGANADRKMGVRILYNPHNGNFVLGPWGVEHEEIFNQAVANGQIPKDAILDEQWSRMRYDVGKKGTMPQFDTEDSLHLHSWNNSDLFSRSSFLATMKSILNHKKEFPDSLKAEFMDTGVHYGGMQTLGKWRATVKKGMLINDMAKSMAKAWFFEPERHAEAARGSNTGLEGSKSKEALHNHLRNAIAVVAGSAILAGGAIALRNPAIRASIANAARYAMGKFPASKVATEAYEATLANGGHTVSLAGKVPEARYMFSPYKANERILSVKHLTPANIDNYIRDNKELLSQPNHHLGTWHNTETGKVHLDVSLPHHDRFAALTDAQKHNQLAIYDRTMGVDIPVNESTINQAKYVSGLRQAVKEGPHSWMPKLADEGFSHDTLQESMEAIHGKSPYKQINMVYNPRSGKFAIGDLDTHHEVILNHVQEVHNLPGKLDKDWLRMSYSVHADKAPSLTLWDWSTEAEAAKENISDNYEHGLKSLIRNKTFPDDVRVTTAALFHNKSTSHTLGEWRKMYNINTPGGIPEAVRLETNKDMETGDIMKVEKEIDRGAMIAGEHAEHPTLSDAIIQQIADDHIKAGKDLLYKAGVETAKKRVLKNAKPMLTKQEVLDKVQELAKVYRGIPTEMDAQPNTKESIDQMQSIDENLVGLHGAIQELEALARDQQLLSDDEMRGIIQPLKEKISSLLNILNGGTIEESAIDSKNIQEVPKIEDPSIATDPQRQRKKPYGPKRVGDGTAERELTEPATDFYDKADSAQDISKGFFGFGGGNRGWHGDPEGHAEAARERWEISGKGKSREDKSGLHRTVANIAVKAARHTGNRVARVAGEAIADIGLATFGAVAGIMILSHLKGKPIPMIQAGKLGITHLKAALENSFKAAEIASMKNEVKLARLKLWLDTGKKLSEGEKEAKEIVEAARHAKKPAQIIKPLGNKFDTKKPSLKTKPKK